MSHSPARPAFNCFTAIVAVASMLTPCVSHAADAPAPKPTTKPAAPAAPTTPPPPAVVLPLERTAHFVGEVVPLALANITGDVLLEAVNADGRVTLYKGPAGPLWLNTARLAPGDYRLELNGNPALTRFTLVSPIRTSPASLQDEATPRGEPDNVHRILAESGLTACVADGAAAAPRDPMLDPMARTATMLIVNPDTRPTSFCPTSLHPAELDGMSQRMILTAQANGRYPNFGGFTYGWDPTGYAVGARKMLLTYWGWGDTTAKLRDYIAKIDQHKLDTFTQRTGLAPVTESEFIAYLLSIKRPEFTPVCDLPTLRWVEEVAQYTKPMSDAERLAFEKRLDAWSNYLMSMYGEVYGTFSKNLREFDPTLKNTASVQIDHAAVRVGQYFPSGYAPLDYRYQSTWNDQVGGPDYAYQPLLTQALLDMGRKNEPTWISNGLASAHHRADYPGKFMRTAAHGLAYGATGAGFACEAFSNILGGMNKETNWDQIKGKNGAADLEAGRDFLQRFAPLALASRGDHGVGILFSKSQFQRDTSYMGFGNMHYKALVVLARMGYTPRFITEEELTADAAKNLKAILVIGQCFPVGREAQAAIEKFRVAGGLVVADGNSLENVPGAKPLGYAFSFVNPGKPHSWSAPNMVEGDNDSLMMGRWEKELGPIFDKAFGETGRSIFKTAAAPGVPGPVTLMQLAAGADAKFVIAVNDSHINTQADWYQVRETLTPGASAGTAVYDCLDEKSLGATGPVVCDLASTTARVYAVLARPLGKTALAATQKIKAGEPVTASVAFLDTAGKPLAAALPFQISLVRPDGQPALSLYRATTSQGSFSIALPTASNAPVGDWKLDVRSLLTGEVYSLPVAVRSNADTQAPASLVTDHAVVRDAEGITRALSKGAQFVLPVFDSPNAPAMLEVARSLKEKLAKQGVNVDVREKPAMGKFVVSYSNTPEEQSENDRCDAGEVIGAFSVKTLNGNDWVSYMSGYRFGKPIILLDLVGQKDNPMAEKLDQLGITWPRVGANYPGAGKAVVQVVRWAFGARVDAIVIQASDVAGLSAGVDALLKLPQDRLMPSVTAARQSLWQQYHVGSAPAQPGASNLSSAGLTNRSEPRPLAMQFPAARPPTLETAKFPTPRLTPALPVPATFTLKNWTIQQRDNGRFIDSATAEFLKSDLRFNDAIKLTLDIPESLTTGETKIAVTGLFRYSDRKPCWQAQWEDLIELREKLVPKSRRPMEVEVLIDGQSAGMLKPTKTEEREVKLELASPSAGLKPRTAVEEVVVELAGSVKLPAGKHEMLLVHKNIVDGSITEVGVGAEPKPLPPPPAPATQKK